MVVARLIAYGVATRGLGPGSPLAPEHEMVESSVWAGLRYETVCDSSNRRGY